MSAQQPQPSTGSRWRRVLWIAALVAYPIAELAVFVQVSTRIGFWWSMAVILTTAALGGWMMAIQSRNSRAAYRRLRGEGRTPEGEIVDVLLIMLGGFLLFLPGYLGDIIGLVAVLPFTRGLLRNSAVALINRWLRRQGVDVTRIRMGRQDATLITGEVVPDPAETTGTRDTTEPPGGQSPDGPLIIRGEVDP